MTDDLFRNMKAQMEPSDDVIADLLAKIAAESGSPVTENNNLVQFPGPAPADLQGKAADAADAAACAAAVLTAAEPTQTKEVTKKRLTKKKKKSIWYYGTAAVACVVLFISTFAVLDQAGDPDDPGAISDLLSRITGSDSLTDPDRTGEEGQTPDGTASDNEQGDPDGEGHDNQGDTPSDSDDQSGSDPSDSDNGDGTDKDGHDNNGDGSGKANQHGGNGNASNEPGNNGPNDDPDDPANQNSGQDASSKPSTPSQPSQPTSPSKEQDNGKVTPGASGTSDIPWTSEIMYASEVASINVSGSNYVVDSTVSTSDLSGTIETVTIDLPSTSSTNATKVKAKVKSLKKVSSSAMVALDVEGFTQPLVYTNADYSPSTLGELVSDLGLEGNTKFSSTVRSQISRVGYSSNHTYHKDIGSAVWSYLLGNSGAERASYNSFNSGTVKVLFTSGSNPTGAQMQFGVSDNGYLYVSMTGGKRFTFHIGSGQAQSFIEYVTGEPVD